MTSSSLIKYLEEKIQQTTVLREFVLANAEKIESLNHDQFTIYGYGIDFDRMTHDQIMRLIQLFPGKWSKEITCGVSDRIDYKLVLDTGVVLRAYAGEPPPSCHIVEEEVVVPAQPEKKTTVRKLVCSDEEGALAV